MWLDRRHRRRRAGHHANGREGSFSLSKARAGDRVRLVAIRAGWSLTRRLLDLGLTPGTEIVVHRAGGPMLVAWRKTSLVMGRGVADKVVVEHLDRGS
jgi:Fe2+ transport system protein FeoA